MLRYAAQIVCTTTLTSLVFGCKSAPNICEPPTERPTLSSSDAETAESQSTSTSSIDTERKCPDSTAIDSETTDRSTTTSDEIGGSSTTELGGETDSNNQRAEDSDTGTSTLVALEARIAEPGADIELYEGERASFTAEVEGGLPPYSYKWTFGSIRIEGKYPGPLLVQFDMPQDYPVSLEVRDAADNRAKDELVVHAKLVEGDMRAWFGSLHGHSSYSDGTGTPAVLFEWARNEAQFDFYAVTDHVESLTAQKWQDTQDAVELWDAPGVFSALRGFEWTHPDFGDLCVFHTADAPLDMTTSKLIEYYQWIDERGAPMQLNHPARWGTDFEGFVYEPWIEDNLVAIETGNKSDGNNDEIYLPWYEVALDRGFRVAPTNNQDNHGLKTTSHRTVCLSARLDSMSLYQAIDARRMYSSDDPNLFIAFRQGEHWMGERVFSDSSQVTFHVKVVDDEPIELVELVGPQEIVLAEFLPETDQLRAIWHPTVTVTPPTYVYVRVTNIDVFDADGPKQVAVTAPIWFY